MNARAILFCTAMLLTACGSSQDDRSATAVSTPQALPSAVVAPQGAASEAVRAAGAESRKVTIPKIRDVRAGGATATAAATAAATPKAATVAPQSGASEAAKAAAQEPREVNNPKTSGVPARGATVAANGLDDLPPGVPYASDTDPVRIVSYVLSSTMIHPGDDITGDVVTSSNVASVISSLGSFSVAVPKVAQGRFHLQMKMPSVPLPPGPTKLIITAIRTDGKSTSRDVAITVEL